MRKIGVAGLASGWLLARRLPGGRRLDGDAFEVTRERPEGEAWKPQFSVV